MNRLSKNKSQSYVLTPSAALLCLFVLSACGLGTEVGNGAKDKEKSKKTATAANNQSGNNEESTNAEDEMDKDSSDTTAKGPTAYGIDMSIIFNSCGSPFEPLYKMPFTLIGKTKSGKQVKLDGDFDATLNTVVISDGNDNVLAKVKDDATADDHKVVVTEKDGSTYSSPYVCSEVEETDEDGIHSYSVILTPVDSEGMTDESKPESTLSWIVNRTQSTPELTSISVTSEEVELLKMESDSE